MKSMDSSDNSVNGNGKPPMKSSAFGTSSSSVPKPQNLLSKPSFTSSQMGGPVHIMRKNSCPESSYKPSIPPSLPCPISIGSQSSSWQVGSQNLSSRPSHSRSMSQPSIFLPDSLPPLSPMTYRELTVVNPSVSTSRDVTMEESAANSHARLVQSPGNTSHVFQVTNGLSPLKGHRRSSSDTPLEFSSMGKSSQLVPTEAWGLFDKSVGGGENTGIQKPILLVKKDHDGESMDERKSENNVVDDLVKMYMNLDNIENGNSSGMDDKDLDSRASGSKTTGCGSSDNEVESGGDRSITNEKREGIKRRADGDVAHASRHQRSFSLDSSIEKLCFEDDSSKLPPLGNQAGQHSPSNSAEGCTSKLSLELGNGLFSSAELKKIMENEKLAEIALADPKRAKRILANRQSAARSKERKVRYMAELENKVQTLQMETTTMSTQFTKLQRDNAELKSENNELKFRLHVLDQQSQLKNSLNKALTSEVQRLRRAVEDLGGEALLASRIVRQFSINQQMSRS